MRQDTFAEKVLNQLETCSNSADVTNEMGTRLIGHVPHIAPKAYVHVVYARLSKVELHELSARLRRPMPTQLCEFLTLANGLSIFVGEMRVLGYVPVKKRASTSVYNYPSNIFIPNVSARIKGLSHGAIVVGWYKCDGSYVSIEEDGTAVRFDSKGDGHAIRVWPDFDTWVTSEISAFTGRNRNVKKFQTSATE